MTSTGDPLSSDWHWPDTNKPSSTLNGVLSSSMPGASKDTTNNDVKHAQQSGSEPQQPGKTQKRQMRHWTSRTCRICLETVPPTIHMPSDILPDLLQPLPSVTYDSPNPEAGRLLRPCQCKGSSKYVHEGCLQAWRHADPGYGKRNYWQCPTCGFRYRLERMAWGRWISSKTTQIVLTVTIFVVALFLMGFVADPIINLYVDPFSALSSPSSLKTKLEPILTDNHIVTWTEHFIKGIASLGLLGFVKVLLASSPWQWWNLRSSGIMNGSGRSSNTGRDRLANVGWIVVLIGVGTFIWAVYKGVRAWSRRTLEKAGERVMDVANEDEDDDENDDDEK